MVGGGALNRPEGLVFDADGNLYIADTFNGRIRRLTSDGRLSIIAGTGATGVFSGDGGPAAEAALSLPTAVTIDSQGDLYIADFGNGRVRKISERRDLYRSRIQHRCPDPRWGAGLQRTSDRAHRSRS